MLGMLCYSKGRFTCAGANIGNLLVGKIEGAENVIVDRGISTYTYKFIINCREVSIENVPAIFNGFNFSVHQRVCSDIAHSRPPLSERQIRLKDVASSPGVVAIIRVGVEGKKSEANEKNCHESTQPYFDFCHYLVPLTT